MFTIETFEAVDLGENL